MRISESENIKTDLEKKEHVDFIELHDRDYANGKLMIGRLGDEFGSRSFEVTLYSTDSNDVETCIKTITCKITYYLHEKCISPELKRFIKKYKKYKNSSGFIPNYECTSHSPKSYFYKKMGVYTHKNSTMTDSLMSREKVISELKKYIQYHPLFIQVVGSMDGYDVSGFDYFSPLV